MPRYPFQPEILDALPEELAELFRDLERKLLEEICSRVRLADRLNEVTVQDIRALRAHGVGLEDIKKAIRKAAGTGEEELEALLDDVVARNQAYYASLIDLAGVTAPERLVDERDIAAIRRQTWGAYKNITGSMGFLTVQGGRLVISEPAKAYEWTLDNALMQVQSGAISYHQAISEQVKHLADRGLCVAFDKDGNVLKNRVAYESGHIDQLDVAVRRAVMTGVNQLNQKYREQSLEYLGTDLVEVTAHLGARNIKGPLGFEAHSEWQGKVYRWSAKPRAARGAYPDFVEKCGYGHVQGIGGANCRHSWWPYIEGVSECTYTDSELEAMKPENRPKIEFEGRKYDDYQATQFQRRMERTVRKLKRRKIVLEATGLTEEADAAGARLRILSGKYRAFSKKAGLPEQRERMRVGYQDGNSTQKSAGVLAKVSGTGIMTSETRRGGGSVVQEIAKIDRMKYAGISEKIRSSTVVLTENQKEHIIKRRGQEFFDKYSPFFREIAEDPDFIFQDKSHEHTAIASKSILLDGKNINLVIRLAVEGDEKGLENSIITAIVENEKRYAQRLRNNIPLYKKG